MSTLEEPQHAAALQVPSRADGVELLGVSLGSGYREPPYLVRRGDGQVLQLTPLLYAVLEAVDGQRDLAGVAACAGESVNRAVSPENVDQLVRQQLLPLGFLRLADGSQPELKKSSPLLGLRFRREVTDQHTTRRLTAPFAVLFQPILVALLVAAFLAVCWWVGWEKGLASATHEALYTPGLLLLVFAITALSAGFHEFGHAAAAKYGGAVPGTMGAGLYLVWPAFYTDVTDSYRLGRAGRLRTDLGGLYFNAIFAVGVFGVWLASGWDFLLLVVVTQVIQMLRQLAPLVRFDGYHVLADLTGVPDLYHHIRPILRGLLPWHWGDASTKVLKPWVKVVVTSWVLVFIPLMLLGLALMVIAFPRLAATAWDSIRDRAHDLVVAYGDGDLTTMAATVLSIVAIALPVLGLVYVVGRLVRQVSSGVWRATEGKPATRGLTVVLALALVAGLVWAWWPKEDRYRPIAAYESGTMADVLPAASQGRPSLEVGSVSSGGTLWPADRRLPTRSEPVLAVVLVPQQGQSGESALESSSTTEVVSAPPATWVFPFDRPPAPEDGDSQAVAVNTADNTIVYDVAFALVWAEEGEAADNVNSAYALASCTNCAAVAVSFQVLLVVGEVNQITPQNLAAAVNYNCIECVTYALAQQLVITLDGPLSDAAMAELTALWAQIAEFAQGIAGVPLSEIDDYLQAFQDQVIEIIEKDKGPLPTLDATETPAPSSSASPSPPGSTSEPEPSQSATPLESPSSTPTPSVTAPQPTASPSPTSQSPVPSDTPSAPSPSQTVTP